MPEITKLAYRVFRDGAQIFTGAFPDEGQHNVSICKRLWLARGLYIGDVIALDCAGEALCYEIAGIHGARAIAKPPYVGAA